MCYLLLECRHLHWVCHCFHFEGSMLADLLLSLLPPRFLLLSLPMLSSSYLKNTTKHENPLCIAFSLIFGCCRSQIMLLLSLLLVCVRLFLWLPPATSDEVEKWWAGTRRLLCVFEWVSNKIMHVPSTNVVFSTAAIRLLLSKLGEVAVVTAVGAFVH